MQQKSDFEIVKELNDLRESILTLKEERDKILRHLNEHGLETKRHFNDIGSEALLSYIQKLTLDKSAMGEELKEREQSIGLLRQQLTTAENRLVVAQEQVSSMKDEVQRLAEEGDRLRRRADEKEREASRCLDMLNRREAELAADLQEKELLTKAANTERDRLLTSLAELHRGVSKAEEDHAETVRLLSETTRALKEKFSSAIAEFMTVEPKKNEEIAELLQKLVERTYMMAQKDAKIQSVEEKAKKMAGKVSILKKELKNVKQIEEDTILKQILVTVQNQKPSGKKSSTLNETAISKLLEAATSNQTKSQIPEIDVLQTEISIAQVSIRKKDAEINHLSERIEVLEIELEKAKDEAKLADKEVKRLGKETKKTTKMFNEEIASLMMKVGSRQAQIQEDKGRELELAVQLKEKKE